jgi:hypothetical protein
VEDPAYGEEVGEDLSHEDSGWDCVAVLTWWRELVIGFKTLSRSCVTNGLTSFREYFEACILFPLVQQSGVGSNLPYQGFPRSFISWDIA